MKTLDYAVYIVDSKIIATARNLAFTTAELRHWVKVSAEEWNSANDELEHSFELEKLVQKFKNLQEALSAQPGGCTAFDLRYLATQVERLVDQIRCNSVPTAPDVRIIIPTMEE